MNPALTCGSPKINVRNLTDATKYRLAWSNSFDFRAVGLEDGVEGFGELGVHVDQQCFHFDAPLEEDCVVW